jgi:hypothetical protein
MARRRPTDCRDARSLGGPIVAALKASPAVSDISAKLFDVLEKHTAITKGLVHEPV